MECLLSDTAAGAYSSSAAEDAAVNQTLTHTHTQFDRGHNKGSNKVVGDKKVSE